jgi:phage FluMu protein Com
VSIICDMRAAKKHRDDIPGECANCKAQVFESLLTLDDAYNVWLGKCPHCKALNFLSMNHGLRGYSSGGMHLVLPTDEEVASNGLPADTITTGKGGPATSHGSPLGELCHRLTEGKL